MGHTSHRWLLSAALIALGTAFDGAAVTLYWRACDGELLNGSVFSTMQSGTGFSDSCLVAMDQAAMFPLPELGDGMTLVASLGAVAALLLASAWLVLLPALDVQGKAARIAALPGTLGIALVVEGVVGSLVPWPDYPDFLFVALAGLLSLSAPFALTALGDAKVTWPVLCGAAVVAFAATAPGFGQQILDFFVMLSLSDADWDKPPGSGYPTVALLAVAAFAIVAVWGWTPSDGVPGYSNNHLTSCPSGGMGAVDSRVDDLPPLPGSRYGIPLIRGLARMPRGIRSSGSATVGAKEPIWGIRSLRSPPCATVVPTNRSWIAHPPRALPATLGFPHYTPP